MADKFLLDTNVISELSRPRPNANVLEFFGAHSDLYISVIVLHEIEFGLKCVQNFDRAQELEKFFLMMRLRFFSRTLNVDNAIASSAAKLRAQEKSCGRVLSELDAFIAATSVVSGLVLVTRNVKDFEHLGLSLRDPFESGSH